MPDRLIGIKEVMSRVGYGKSKIYALMAQKKFPQQCKEGRQALWSEAEINQYVENKKQARQQNAA